MTDHEMTKLCAEAMGLGASKSEITEGHWLQGNEWIVYDPLHDDAQAMALLKRFDIVVERDGGSNFGVTLFVTRRRVNHDTIVVRREPDLNRAIVECVAKMQAAKGHDAREE